ncbi:hypothetical protein Q9L58_007634 [Maublancomyces gigas]|uniref:Uncharacterized protein n=1 Tax=Discina gigas TaxID=1032678 RepID=A0ABR3GC09_9PEZI
MSRNNSVSTTSTKFSSSTRRTSLTRRTSFESLSPSGDHVISDFNPTLILQIPPHGAFKRSPAAGVEIHDITPWLPGYNRHTLTIPDSVGPGDIRAAVAARGWSEGDAARIREKGSAGSALVSKRHSRWSSRSTVQMRVRERHYTDSAEWRVPWDTSKPSTITLKPSAGMGEREEKRIDVWCGREDRRAQVWTMEGGVSFAWRWEKSEEGREVLVLDKEGEGMGSHRIGMFLFKDSVTPVSMLSPSSGTLILDERGLSRVVAVSSILIFLKRDRQRRGMCGRT